MFFQLPLLVIITFITSVSSHNIEKCEPACKNSGICVYTNTCDCPPNFHGKYCEIEKKPCLSYPPLPMNSQRKCISEMCIITCMDGHKFFNGFTVASMRCSEGQWVPSTVPDCYPECSPPCMNGGFCLATNNACDCPANFEGNQCQYQKCEPACKNSGICVYNNNCHCPSDFHGKYCEIEKKHCLSYPPLPMNSRRKCRSEICTITCMEGHKFFDGSAVASMKCSEGQWVPSTISDCYPECSPPCMNGGICLAANNTCDCPANFEGNQCQYLAKNPGKTTIIVSVVSTVGGALVLCGLAYLILRLKRRNYERRLQALISANFAPPFYLNLILRDDCDREINEIDQHVYEEIGPPVYEEIDRPDEHINSFQYEEIYASPHAKFASRIHLKDKAPGCVAIGNPLHEENEALPPVYEEMNNTEH